MKLIILNGPSGVGKSTVAAQLHTHLPTSVLIDVDALRRTIPNYRENRVESLRAAYELAAKAIEDGFAAQKDLIVDKNILENDVLDTLVAVATNHGAKVYEFMLFASKETVLKRASDRGFKEGGMLTPEKVDEHWERAKQLQSERPSLIAIDTTDLNSDQVFALVNEKMP